jgi:hypothetical protein
MCMEDIRLGRALASSSAVVSAPNAASGPLVGADPKRTRLVVTTQGATVKVAPAGIDVTTAAAFVTSGTLPPIVLLVEELGKILQGPWTCSAPVGPVACLVIESTLEKD